MRDALWAVQLIWDSVIIIMTNQGDGLNLSSWTFIVFELVSGLSILPIEHFMGVSVLECTIDSLGGLQLQWAGTAVVIIAICQIKAGLNLLGRLMFLNLCLACLLISR
jgi:hypothetical protein